MIADLSDIDLSCPIDWTNTRNAGLVLRLLGLPGTVGGDQFPDLSQNVYGSFALGGQFGVPPTWTPTGRGDVGLFFPDNTWAAISTGIPFQSATFWCTPRSTPPGNDQGYMLASASGLGFKGIRFAWTGGGVGVFGYSNVGDTVNTFAVGQLYRIALSANNLYVNGVLQSLAGSAGGPFFGMGSVTGTVIGTQQRSNLFDFAGLLADMSLYTRVLSDSECVNDYPSALADVGVGCRRVRSLRSIALMASGGGGDTGIASITLDACVLSSAGSLKLQASSSLTLGTLSLTSAGLLHLQAASAITMGDVVLTSHGLLAIAGSSSVTLGPVTLTSAGSGNLSAEASITLASVQLSASGVLHIAAGASIVLASLQLTSAGTLAIGASAAILLAPLTLIAAGGIPLSVLPGGIFSRPAWSLARVFSRSNWLRKFLRPAPSMSRIWSYKMPNSIPPQSLAKAVSDDRDFIFDFSRSPEVVGGATISSATIEGGDGLTIAAASVLALTTDGIPAGQGVSVEISGGSADTTYDLACRAVLSTGRVIVIPARLAVAADF